MFNLIRALIFAGVVIVSACGPTGQNGDQPGGSAAPSLLDQIAGPQVPDQPFLLASGFSQPIDIRADLQRVFASDALVDSDEARKASFLWKNGDLGIGPNPNGGWWYTFLPRRGALVGGTSFVPPAIAIRRIVGRANQRRWSENASEYFAETISYIVHMDDRLTGIPTRDLGPFELRLVAVNNPRIGEWRVSSADFIGGAEQRALNQLIDQTGRAAAGDFLAAAQSAVGEAYNQYEANLASQGIIARTSDENVIVSRNAGLAYYVGTPRVPELAAMERNAARARAEQMCRELSVSGYRGWRLPRLSEFQAVTSPQSTNNFFRTLIDAPDWRLWRDFGRAVYPREIIIPTEDPPPYAVYAPTHVRIAAGGVLAQSNGSDGWIGPRNDGAVVCVAPLASG